MEGGILSQRNTTLRANETIYMHGIEVNQGEWLVIRLKGRSGSLRVSKTVIVF